MNEQAFPTLTLKSGRDRSVSNQHPWVFSGAVKSMDTAQNGDIIRVADNHGRTLGFGFYSPKSQIVCRLFHFTLSEQAQTAPRFDTAYWVEKVRNAFALRRQFVGGMTPSRPSPSTGKEVFDVAPSWPSPLTGKEVSEESTRTTAYRLLHAEGDFFPGVIVDIYGAVAVVQVLIKGAERVLPHVLEALQQLGWEHIYLKNKENSGFLEEVAAQNGWLLGGVPGPVQIEENGYRFGVDVEKGQKTGFFLDQRDNRLLLKQFCKGKKVLNAFSYTGGFSVYALAGGASLVHSVDVSKPALAIGEEAIRANFGENAPHASIAEDCFQFLRNSQEQYDVIVLDPPAFAKNQRTVPNAARGYKDLNYLGIKQVAPGGVVFTFSCSGNVDRDLFRKIVFSAAADAGRRVRILHQLTQPADHPINIYHPEGEYLKGLVLYVE